MAEYEEGGGLSDLLRLADDADSGELGEGLHRLSSLAAGSLAAIERHSDGGPPFNTSELTTLRVVVEQSSMLLTHAMEFAGAGRLIQQLQEAVESRDLIGQAKGILMVRESCDAAEAFEILRRASQRTNRKLRDIAQELVDSTVSRPSEAAL